MWYNDPQDYDKQIALPCHMTEYKQLEAFLEQKARDGLMLQYFSPLFNYGYFGHAIKKNYHCCVDVYYQTITDKVFDSNVFNEYLDTCKQCGWISKTYYKNIIVFFSEAEERPADLQSDEELTYDLLKKTTVKIESWQLLAESLFRILLCLFLTYSYFMSLRNHEMDGNIYILVISIGLGTYTALKIIAHLRVVHALKNNRPLPEKTGAWTSALVTNVGILCYGFYALWMSIRWTFGISTLLSALLLFFNIWHVFYLQFQKNHETRLYSLLLNYENVIQSVSIAIFMIIMLMVTHAI